MQHQNQENSQQSTHNEFVTKKSEYRKCVKASSIARACFKWDRKTHPLTKYLANSGWWWRRDRMLNGVVHVCLPPPNSTVDKVCCCWWSQWWVNDEWLSNWQTIKANQEVSKTRKKQSQKFEKSLKTWPKRLEHFNTHFKVQTNKAQQSRNWTHKQLNELNYDSNDDGEMPIADNFGQRSCSRY